MESEHPNYNYTKLVNTVAHLRAPGGCPWDREQTHGSLTECLVEECAELLEAIDNLDYEHMVEELGDVLLNVLMQAEIANESGRFSIEDVCKEIDDKLIRRHPHVFERSETSIDNPEKVVKRWEEIKATEKKNGKQAAENSPFKPQPPRLPSLLFAKKTFKQIEKAKLSDHDALPITTIESVEQMNDEQLAETLFAAAAVCKKRSLDPEKLLRQYTASLRETLA